MFKEEVRKAVDAAKEVFKTSSLFGALIGFLAELSILSAIWYGGNLVVGDVLSVGQLIAFLIYIMNIIGPFTSIAQTWVSWQQSLAASRRVFEILEEKTEETPEEETIDMPPIKGHIVFENVSFTYKDGKEVLRGVNLEVKPGETLALVGPSGAGKSTIVNLLMRFYKPTEGRILIDGIDISKVNPQTLRKQMGIVPQEPFLFALSIRDNIAVGKPDASLEEIIRAAKIAKAHDFITSLSKGYETVIGERGCTLSGGQRQRIAIARAIIRDPRILIFDEATSALDSESEAQIQNALREITKGRTTIIVAHRLSTFRKADRIAVIDEGRVVEEGTHEELMAKKGLYYRLYGNQA
ncbi:ABC transporter ATP-binding protein [Candidatus Bathyarchaeota archaeon]|nr:MAG: ABC transporter ATP-binding protein [Candidatus Bathyarchaeota archaeon]